MRSLIVSLLCLSAVSHAQSDLVPNSNQIIPVEDFREKTGGVMVVDGTPMVKGTMISMNWITWDEDGTTYLVAGDYTGVQTKMQISSIGAAKSKEMWYRFWPVLHDRRGDVFVIDDSKEQDYRAKLQYWMTAKGLIQGGRLALPIGFSAAVVQAAFVDLSASILYTGAVTSAAVYVLRAVMDLRKTHRELNRGFNFFTRRIARNVQDLRYIHHTNGELDIELVYKNGDSRGQPVLMSEIFGKPGLPQYQHQNCIEFLRGKEK